MTPNNEVVVTEDDIMWANAIVKNWPKDELAKVIAKLVAIARTRKEEIDGEAHDERISF